MKILILTIFILFLGCSSFVPESDVATTITTIFEEAPTHNIKNLQLEMPYELEKAHFECPTNKMLVGPADSANAHPHPHPHCECGQCIGGGVTFITEHLYVKFVEKCDETKCPVFKKWCKRMEKIPGVMKGMLMASHNVGDVATAFCIGEHQCWPRAFDMVEELEMKMDPLIHIMHHFTRSQIRKAVETAYAAPVENDAFDRPSHSCGECIMKWSRHVMGGAIKALKLACKEDTRSRPFQMFCKWGKTHPQEALGILVTEVNPGLFSYGVCITNKSCPHPQPPHIDWIKVEEEKKEKAAEFLS